MISRDRVGDTVEFVVAAGFVVFALAFLNVARCAAQAGGIDWSEPVNLSESPEGSVNPAIAADSAGVVHVFWSEDAGGKEVEPADQLETLGNTIMYRRWDGTSWSDSVDVLAVNGDPFADFVSVDIDDSGIIHATWTGMAATYYSWAPSWEADDARAWAAPVIIGDNARSQRESSVAVSPSGDVHVIYATRGAGAGVHHIVLRKGATAWTVPVTISVPLEALEQGYANVRLVADTAGRLHATWQTFQEEGYGQGVYYARSLDDGVSWSTTVLFRYRLDGDTWVEWPYLTVGGDVDLYLIYVDGTNRGRAFRVSRDGGETWSAPRSVLQELEGINGYVMPIVDGLGQVHIIANMRTHEGQIGGIYQSTMLGGILTPAELIIRDGHTSRSGNIHYTAATLRLQNEVHLVWNEVRGSEIWYVRGTFEGVEPATPQLTRSPAQPTTAPPATPGILAPTPVYPPPLSAGSVSGLVPQSEASYGLGTSIWTPVFVAAVPVLLILVGVLVWRTHNR